MPSSKRLEKQADIFARAIHEGKSQRTAYRESHPESTASDEAADVQGHRWANSDKVLLRLAELEAQAADNAIANEQVIQAGLTNIALDADENTGARLKAFDQLAKMQGAYIDRKEFSGGLSLDIETARAEAWDALQDV